MPNRSARAASVDAATNALMTQRMLPATSAACSGVSWPCSWRPSRRPGATMSMTRPGSSSRNTPTVRISGGSRRVMSYTCWAATWRVDGANTNPTASAPMATANSASSSLVIPQIFTNIGCTVPIRHPNPRNGLGDPGRQTRSPAHPRVGFVPPESGRAARRQPRRLRIAAAGSPAVTRVSPTRTAW